jgi:hypothetical protein
LLGNFANTLKAILPLPEGEGLEFGHLSPDANGVSSYQPGATPQEKRANEPVERQRRDS